MKIIVGLAVMGAILFSSGCQPGFVDPSTSSDITPSQTPAPGIPTQGDIQMTPSIPSPANPGLQSLIDKAKADLAQRLSISVQNIVLVEATSVVWPNASLGCPQKGMVYAEVLTPGYLIILNADNNEYEYHASRGTQVIYCVNPTPPVPGMPGSI